MGFLDRPQRNPSIPENDPESGKTALAIAEEGIVLLKNEKKTLPFDQRTIKKIAVLGPEAQPGVPTGWGSSYVTPFYAVSVLDGLMNNKGPDMSVDYFDVGVGNFGTSQFEHEDRTGKFADGLQAEYFSNLTSSGTRDSRSSRSTNQLRLGVREPSAWQFAATIYRPLERIDTGE